MYTEQVKTAPTFEGYEGAKMFVVSHPKHRDVIVHAPDADAAIVAAAKYWRERWQAWEFYSPCVVRKSE